MFFKSLVSPSLGSVAEQSKASVTLCQSDEYGLDNLGLNPGSEIFGIQLRSLMSTDCFAN